MKKYKRLLAECKSRAYDLQLSYNQNVDISICISNKYGENTGVLWYTDGHLKPKRAIKRALKWLKKANQ